MEKVIEEFYLSHHKDKIYQHVVSVSKVAKDLALQFNLDTSQCVLASLLHDISGVMTPSQMYQFALDRHFEIDPAEEKYPILLHQRISRIIAQETFHITDEIVLSAIECHTTLKKNSSNIDKVVFLADKIAWDQDGTPPYVEGLKKALDQSLDNGCYYFIKYQLDHQLLLMPHHWLIEAYEQLSI